MLGPHLGNATFGNLLGGIEEWNPFGVLTVDPGRGTGAALKGRMAQGGTLVGRVFKPDGEIDARIRADYKEAAQWAFDLISHFAQGNAEVDYWQFTNEILNTTPEDVRLLGKFSVELAQKMDRVRLRLGAAGFSTGTPRMPHEGPEWAIWCEYWEHLLEMGALLVLHEYGEPQQEGGSIFDDAPWHLGRYAEKVQPALDSMFQEAPWFLGETGCDMRRNRKGWRTGYNGDVARYIRDLVKWDRQLSGYRACKGGVIFTVTHAGGWDDFEMEAHIHQLAAQVWYLPAVATPTPAPTPVPAPTPTEDITARFVRLARREFGELFEDLRGKLPVHRTLRFSRIDSRRMPHHCFHHSATPKTTTWKRIADDHITASPPRKPDEFAEIGYHGGIRMGKVGLFGSLDTQRAHVKGKNHLALGWCVMGNYDTTALPPETLDLMRRLVKVLDETYGHEKSITAHGLMLPNYTACPGSAVQAALPRLRQHQNDPYAGYSHETYQKWAYWLERGAREARDRGDHNAHDTIVAVSLPPVKVKRDGRPYVLAPYGGYDLLTYQKWAFWIEWAAREARTHGDQTAHDALVAVSRPPVVEQRGTEVAA
jgi:hypothetical protein